MYTSYVHSYYNYESPRKCEIFAEPGLEVLAVLKTGAATRCQVPDFALNHRVLVPLGLNLTCYGTNRTGTVMRLGICDLVKQIRWCH